MLTGEEEKTERNRRAKPVVLVGLGVVVVWSLEMRKRQSGSVILMTEEDD